MGTGNGIRVRGYGGGGRRGERGGAIEKEERGRKKKEGDKRRRERGPSYLFRRGWERQGERMERGLRSAWYPGDREG